jgi:hypothetical protein
MFPNITKYCFLKKQVFYRKGFCKKGIITFYADVANIIKFCKHGSRGRCELYEAA